MSLLKFTTAVGNFGVNTNNLFVFYSEKRHDTHRQLLVCDMVWEYPKISVFPHDSVFRIGKNPIASI